MHSLYFLYSSSLDKYYVGQSADVNERVLFHNSSLNNIWTKRGKPWLLIACFEFPSKRDALIAERFVKKQKSRKTIEKIIEQGYIFNGNILPNLVRSSDPG